MSYLALVNKIYLDARIRVGVLYYWGYWLYPVQFIIIKMLSSWLDIIFRNCFRNLLVRFYSSN